MSTDYCGHAIDDGVCLVCGEVRTVNDMIVIRRRDAAWLAGDFGPGRADFREHPETECSADRDRHALIEVIDKLLVVVDATRFRASVTFTNLDPQPEGPDMLEAIAAWMDKMDDRLQLTDERPVSRQVQADIRRWSASLRLALDKLNAP